MNAAVQKATGVNPGKNRQDLNTASISNPTGLVKNANSSEDFRSILLNSNYEEKKKREGDSKGDLAGAKNYDDFLERLNRQTQQKDAPKNNLDKDDFLKLFVTQLQSQDPLNPQDGSQMAAQLAQFNSLEQMLNVNKTLEKMVGIQNSGKALQYVNYIGKELSVNGGSVRLNQGKTNDIFMSSDSPLGVANLTVKDSFGKIVAQRDLGAMDSGLHKVVWDGKDNNGKSLGDGKYTFDISGRSGKGDPVDVKMNSKVVVTGVDLGESGENVFTSIGSVPFNQIQAVGSIGFSSEKVKEANAAIKVKSVAAVKDSGETKNSETTVSGSDPSGESNMGSNSNGATSSMDSTEGLTPNSVSSGDMDSNEISRNNLENDVESAPVPRDSKQLESSRTEAISASNMERGPGDSSQNSEETGSKNVSASDIPPEIRAALEAKFNGSLSQQNPNAPSKKGRIAVNNAPQPR